MRVVEVVGGLYVNIPVMEYKLLKALHKKGIKKFPVSSLNEKVKVLADNLVDYHVLDKDSDYYYIREVHLDE